METTFYVFYIFNSIFFFAIFGIINNRNNLMIVLICVELCYLMLISLFLCSSFIKYQNVFFQGYCLFFLAVAASESAVGLSLLIVTYKSALKTKITNIQILYG